MGRLGIRPKETAIQVRLRMALDGVIFDIDGTLMDTNGYHVQAWRRAFERYGYMVQPDRIETEIGKGGDKLVPSILGRTAEEKDGDSLRKASAEEFQRLAKEQRFKLFPGAEALLQAIRRRGLQTAIATSAGAQHLEAMERSAGVRLADLVDTIVTASDADASKPSPDIVMAAYRELGLSPAQCAMVGDTSYDAEACRHAGVVMFGVLTGYHTVEALTRAGARRVWHDVAELCAHLDEALELAAPGAAHLTWEMLERLMREALAVARAGMRQGEAPIGAILARGDGSIVSRGYNEMRSRGNKIAHAEIVAFEHAAGLVPLDARDLILVSTLEPCVMCTGAAMAAAVDVIVYGLGAPADSGTGRVRSPESPENQMPRIIGEILPDECRALFQEWMRDHADREQSPYIEQLLAGSGRDR